MVFITAGDGLCTVGCVLLSSLEVARENGILTCAVGPKPFPFEAASAWQIAEKYPRAEQHVDHLSPFPNEKASDRAGQRTASCLAAFSKANDVNCFGAVQGMRSDHAAGHDQRRTSPT